MASDVPFFDIETTQVLVRAFVRDRQPDADTLAAIADEVGEDVAKIEAWFVDRSSHLPAETAAHLSMLGAGPSDMDPGSPGSSLDGDSRVSSSAIRSRITQALKSLDPPEFVPRGALWDLVNVDNNFTNKQFGSSLQGAYTGNHSVVVRRQESDGSWVYGLREWGTGGAYSADEDAQVSPSRDALGFVAEGGSGGKMKFRMTEAHEALLKDVYVNKTTRPDKHLMADLADQLGCKLSTLKAWFRKKRQEDELREFTEKRRKEREGEDGSSSAAPLAASAGGAAASEQANGGPAVAMELEGLSPSEQSIFNAFVSALEQSSHEFVTRGNLLAMLPKSLGFDNKEAGDALRSAMKRPNCPILKEESADGKSWVYGLRTWPKPGEPPQAPVASAPLAPKTPKFKMDAASHARLDEAFRLNPKPSKDETQALADELTCQRSTVVAWFRNKRKAVSEEMNITPEPSLSGVSLAGEVTSSLANGNAAVDVNEYCGAASMDSAMDVAAETVEASAATALTKSQLQNMDRKRKAVPGWNDKWTEDVALNKIEGLNKKARSLEHTKTALIAKLDSNAMVQ